MALVTLVVVMIAVAVVAIVTIVAVAAVVQMRGLALGLHCADCIICIVRIVSCPARFSIDLGVPTNDVTFAKEEGLIVRNCMVASSYTLCLATREYAVPKTDVFVRCLRNYPVELLEE